MQFPPFSYWAQRHAMIGWEEQSDDLELDPTLQN